MGKGTVMHRAKIARVETAKPHSIKAVRRLIAITVRDREG